MFQGRRSLDGRRILLTGASSGIGRELALQLAPYHTHLLLLARREEPLAALADELKRRGAASAQLIVGDVTDPAVRAAAIEHVQMHWQGLDLLVNNAGVSAHGRFENNGPDALRKILEVNFFAATELTRAALPWLSTGNDPVLVNIGSILGHRGIPLNSEYCASKFALRGWSESLRPELARHGIDVLLVSPGTTDTEFFEHLISTGEKLPWKTAKGLPAAKVAAQIVHAIERRRHEIYPNWRGRALVLLNRAAPWLVDRIMGRYG